jgi:hypothetical protein
MNTPLEQIVIEKYFRKEKQDRYKGFIASARNRKKFIDQLSHLQDLEWSKFQKVPSFSPALLNNSTTYESVYVISENPAVDGSSVSLETAFEMADSRHAMILVFGNADRVYYEGEPPDNRFISK